MQHRIRVIKSPSIEGVSLLLKKCSLEESAGMTEKEEMIQVLQGAYTHYFQSGPRSSKKVDWFHDNIIRMVKPILPTGYRIQKECPVPSINETGWKKCDLVIFRGDQPHIIIPTKIIMSNYQQNRNNYYESATGEFLHLRWANDGIHILPIYVIADRVPYLDKDGRIKCFETPGTDSYRTLVQRGVCDRVLLYKPLIDYRERVGERFQSATIQDIPGFQSFLTTIQEFLVEDK